MKALLIVDVQNDFLPGGALAVSEGDKIVPIINELMNLNFDLIIATKDWHPSDHFSFAENHGKNVGEHIKTSSGMDQILWPKHCVQQSKGAEFAAGLDTTKFNKVFYKGSDASIDSYSAFYDNEHMRSTGLENYLRGQNVSEIYITGLATDYCVLYTVKDALELGFKIFVLVDACKGVNIKPHDSTHALQKMSQLGATLIFSKDLVDGTLKL